MLETRPTKEWERATGYENRRVLWAVGIGVKHRNVIRGERGGLCCVGSSRFWALRRSILLLGPSLSVGSDGRLWAMQQKQH